MTDIEQINCNTEELQGRLQQRYGWEKEREKKEIDKLEHTIHKGGWSELNVGQKCTKFVYPN